MDDAQLGAAIRAFVSQWVEWSSMIDAHENQRELEERVEGWRIVDGGQVAPDGAWEITDAESGELLAEGVGLDSFRDAFEGQGWYHRDRIGTEAYDSVAQPTDLFGLPPDLASVLEYWVLDHVDSARRLLSEDE